MSFLGKKHSAVTRAKLAAISAGNKHFLGRKHSEETKAKISASNKGKNLGNKLSSEHNIKLQTAAVEANRRRVWTKESREKLSRWQLGKSKPECSHKHTEETKRLLSKLKKGKPASPALLKHLRRLHQTLIGSKYRYQGIWMRSSFEMRVAAAFDALGIRWLYEPKRFDLGDTTYLPDFYLPDDDAYWEVKGWLSPVSLHKITRFRELNPEIPLVVIKRCEVELLEQAVSR
jgi:hypothetical protein